jgi:hypothetical protein
MSGRASLWDWFASKRTTAGGAQEARRVIIETGDRIEELDARCDTIDTEHAEFAETTLEALTAIRKRLDELEFDGLIEDIEDSAKAPTLEMRIQRIELMLGIALAKGVVS